ncbi:hypothetical protein VNO77_06184 [Canavalia gladiata]|uniref:F-box domain-containing protein n=1 Tax=Canavalia gladiata TaxID=3824 RepID=A0AAN9M733_CANGL
MAMDMADMSCSLSNINHLPDEVLTEIFIRLPFRSTAKCKCVCKRWLELISSPPFPKQFISHQHSMFKAFLVFLSPHELMLTFLPPNPSFILPIPTPLSPDMLIKGYVCGSSNGLFLCCNNRYTTGCGYYVYDPFTKETTHIAPSTETHREHLYAVGFVSDPGKSFWVVIIKSFIRRVFEFQVEVFFSETGIWKQVDVSFIDGFAFAPHWMLSLAYEGRLYFMGRTSIFVFDPVSLNSYILEYPHDADAMNIMSFGYLGNSCGNLRIADIGRNDLRVWELGPQEWILMHRTHLTAHLPPMFCANYYKRVGGFHPYDGDIVYLHSYAEGVFAANLRTNKFHPIPGYHKSDISPFQLLLPPPIPQKH